MKIRVNAADHEAPAEATVADLIAQLGMNPKFVAVELNQQLAPRKRHAEIRLTEGDEVEIVTLVGGG